MDYLLSIIIFFPALAALLLLILRSENTRIFAIIVAATELFFTLLLWNEFHLDYGGIQFFSHFPLIASYGINYDVGIDGISLFLIILNAFITLLGIYFFKQIRTPFAVAILFTESIVMGVFSALDVILFYIFWELSLIPVLYIIGVWGGEKRAYAALKYFIYAFGASLIMLMGILYYAYQYFLILGIWSFNLLDWYAVDLDLSIQGWIFLAFFIGIAVKIPLFPLHSWQPHAYTQAPIVGSALIAGVLSKMGTYALVRFILPLFPVISIDLNSIISILCVIMVIYGALLAFAQTNIKTLIAYASISHMGIIVLGVFSLNIEGMSGAIFFMIAHGVIVAALFLLVGVLYERIQSQQIDACRGIANVMPHFATIFGIVMMSALGLPLTMGFVGEFLALLGFFQVNPIITLLAGTSFFVGAIYMLNVFKKVFLGSISDQHRHLNDLNLREKLVFLPIIVLIVWLGVYPKLLLEPIDVSVRHINLIIFHKIQTSNHFVNFLEDPQENLIEIPNEFNRTSPDDILIIPNLGD